MRVLYLNPVGSIAGPERALLAMMQSLREQRPDVELHLIAGTEGAMVQEALALGVQARVLEMPGALVEIGQAGSEAGRWGASFTLLRRALLALPATRRYVGELETLIASIAPDVLHSNGTRTHLLSRLTGWKAGPVLWHIHEFLSRRTIQSRLLRYASGEVAGAIAVSQAVAEDAKTVLSEVPVGVIRNGVDTEHFSPGGRGGPPWPLFSAEREGQARTAAPTAVGMVATYARWKGQDAFLAAAAKVLAEKPGSAIHFYIVGGPVAAARGPQFSLAELKAKAAELGIAEQVDFVPWVADPVKAYRDLDVVVHASTQPEPCGLAVIEAMACGRPAIVSAAGGAAELFKDGEDALGVPPGDVAALAGTMRRLIDEPELRQRLSERARQTAVEGFSHTRLAPQLMETYEHFIRARGVAQEEPAAPEAPSAPSAD